MDTATVTWHLMGDFVMMLLREEDTDRKLQ